MIATYKTLRDTAWAAGMGLFAVVVSCAAEPLRQTDNSACPPWVQGANGDHSNAEAPDLGCSNRRNLERMIEDSHDLEHGRALGPADAEHEGLAVKNYEEGKVKDSTSTTSTPGALIVPGTPSEGGQ